MKNLKKWFDSHSNQTKIELAIGVGVQMVYTLYHVKDYGYIPSPYYVLGQFIGLFGSVLIISIIISIIFYFIFRGVAETRKKYLDYLSIIFLIISFIIIFIISKSITSY